MTKITKEAAEVKNYPRYNREEPCPTCGKDVFYIAKPDICVECEHRRTTIFNKMKKNRNAVYTAADRMKIIEDHGGSFMLDLVIRTQANRRLSIALLVDKETRREVFPIGAFDWMTDGDPEKADQWEMQIREDWGFADVEADDE